MARLVVELVSRAFEKLPDGVLLPWLPSLLMTLRPHAATLVPTLLKEAATCYPDELAALAGWVPPWTGAPPGAAAAPQAIGAAAVLSESEQSVEALLFAEPAAANALAALLGLAPKWGPGAEPRPGKQPGGGRHRGGGRRDVTPGRAGYDERAARVVDQLTRVGPNGFTRSSGWFGRRKGSGGRGAEVQRGLKASSRWLSRRRGAARLFASTPACRRITGGETCPPVLAVEPRRETQGHRGQSIAEAPRPVA